MIRQARGMGMRSLAALMGAACLGLAAAGAWADGGAAADYTEGFEYQAIVPPGPLAGEGDGIEVAELFWYGCPHCYRFEPLLEAWLERKPGDVRFVRVAVPLNPHWEPHARAWYSARLLGVAERTHRALFDAIHAERQRLADREALAGFYARHGADRDAFLRAFDSFAVHAKVRRAAALARAWGVHSVPTMVVNGRYRVTGRMAGGLKEMLAVVDHLIGLERARLARERNDAAGKTAAAAQGGDRGAGGRAP